MLNCQLRGTSGSAGYDLAAAQSAVVPAHGKCLVKTGLSMALPPGCYGRIAPRSGLAWRKFIDVGAGVIDADYRGELGVILFNFGEEDFVINMGDKVAQLIFEKIKTPAIRETNDLEDTERGDRGFGSTGIKSEHVQDIKPKIQLQKSDEDQTKKMNEAIPEIKNKRSQLEKARQIISARQLQKLAKDDSPVFLAIVRSNDSPTNDTEKRRTISKPCGKVCCCPRYYGRSKKKNES